MFKTFRETLAQQLTSYGELWLKLSKNAPFSVKELIDEVCSKQVPKGSSVSQYLVMPAAARLIA